MDMVFNCLHVWNSQGCFDDSVDKETCGQYWGPELDYKEAHYERTISWKLFSRHQDQLPKHKQHKPPNHASNWNFHNSYDTHWEKQLANMQDKIVKLGF